MTIRITPRRYVEDNAPTPERLRHANDNYVSIGGAHLMQDAPIAALYRAGKITKVQHQAAERFFADFYDAGLAPLGAQDYGRPVVDGRSPRSESDKRFAAVDRYNAACKSLSRYGLREVDRVVLRLMPVGDLTALRFALARLAVGYGLETK